MNEKPLERLNYYNGMPLQASDLKTEQDYHMRTRRWVNKSLYSAGIARGLEVRAVPPDTAKTEPPQVAVSPGLALDNEGREIILFDEALVEICSYAGTNESTVVGNYLVIEYAEETIAYESGGCAVRTPGTSASKSTNQWGGPSRIQARVKFSWVPFVPQPGSNQIVLARVELKQPGCGEVHQIDAGARRYIGAASAAKVRQYALEGERHVDSKNPAKIHFHIRGRQPNSVTLYLRAEKFSTLYYTEMGWHEHAKTLTGNTETGPAKAVDDHKHAPAPTMKTQFDANESGERGKHLTHVAWAEISARPDPPTTGFNFFDVFATVATLGAYGIAKAVADLRTAFDQVRDYPESPDGNANPGNPSWFALRVITRVKTTDHPNGRVVNLKENIGLSVEGGEHQHNIVGETENPKADSWPTLNNRHKHDLSTSLTIDKAGVDQVDDQYKARSGQVEKALTYVDNLQVFIGLENKTPDILGQLRDAQQGITWDKLGNGTAGHVLAVEGTRAIRLDFLPGVTFSEGREYFIDLRVASGGGRILYNLYVE